MEPLKLSDLYSIFGLERGSDDEIEMISTDTRSIGKNSFYIPLKGEHFDGHNFIGDAFAKGARAALCREDYPYDDPRVIKVPDTLCAYHKIASWYRNRFNIPVIAITGSNGKTGTKDMTAAILASRFRTLKTHANYNNEIGVPETLLKIDRHTEALVIELGMRGAGQILQLRDIVKPDIAIITMVGESHFELLGSHRAIADAKAEIAYGFGDKNVLILNAEDGWSDYIAQKSTGRVMFFGRGEKSSLRIISVAADEQGGFNLKFSYAGEEFEGSLPFPGIHNIYNASAAMLAAALIGVPPRQSLNALRKMEKADMSGKRMEIISLASGMMILNDCYNASPSSVKAALETIKLQFAGKRKIALLGDMKELGELSEKAHRDLGSNLLSYDIESLVTVGPLAFLIGESAVASGFPPKKWLHFEDSHQAALQKEQFLERGDLLLVKGSRAMQLENIVNYILKKDQLQEG